MKNSGRLYRSSIWRMERTRNSKNSIVKLPLLKAIQAFPFLFCLRYGYRPIELLNISVQDGIIYFKNDR